MGEHRGVLCALQPEKRWTHTAAVWNEIVYEADQAQETELSLAGIAFVAGRHASNVASVSRLSLLLERRVGRVVARVKKDKTSWNAGGVIHRDNRHDHSVDGATGSAKKKNTRKWCKGILGRHHVPIWSVSKHGRWRNPQAPVMEVVCENCSKCFETDWGFLGRPKKGREVLMEKWKKKLGG